MKRFQPVHSENTHKRSREILQSVEKRLGMTPRYLQAMAISPAALDAYNGVSCALENGVLPARLRQQVALAVSQTNNCPYCLAAHRAIGRSVGLNEDDIADSRKGISPDSKVAVVLSFVRSMVAGPGRVKESDLALLFQTGYSEEEVIEIVANVALTVFGNYFNLMANPDIDFPVLDSGIVGEG